MPSCNQCDRLDTKNAVCVVKHRKPLRNCILPIVEGYHKLFFKGAKVLEIGCGAWSPSRDFCVKEDINWEGIDVLTNYMGKPTVATKIASVRDIPFESDYFDFVIGNQTIEHWDENGVPIRAGLSEVFRVLKPGGLALFNAPIHFHGDFLFVAGDMDGIRKSFEPFCSEFVMESWRKPSNPLPELYYLKHLYSHKPSLRDSRAYMLDIQAKKRTDAVPYFRERSRGGIFRLIEGVTNRGFWYYLNLFSLKLEILIGKKLR